jgi:dynein heavy chain
VLDFSVTQEGLEQQLLQIVCKSESAKEEDEREKLTKQGLLFTQQKKQIVNDILDTLRNSGKNILESDDLVNKLESSKQLTNEINHKLNVARHIEERIEENRKIFKPVAEHGARLYFAVQDLPLLDPMYQFSMKWFKDLFDSCFVIEGEEKKEEEKPEEHSFNDDVTPPTRTKKALNNK